MTTLIDEYFEDYVVDAGEKNKGSLPGKYCLNQGFTSTTGCSASVKFCCTPLFNMI